MGQARPKELRPTDPGHRRAIASWVNESPEGCEDPTGVGDTSGESCDNVATSSVAAVALLQVQLTHTKVIATMVTETMSIITTANLSSLSIHVPQFLDEYPDSSGL